MLSIDPERSVVAELRVLGCIDDIIALEDADWLGDGPAEFWSKLTCGTLPHGKWPDGGRSMLKGLLLGVIEYSSGLVLSEIGRDDPIPVEL